MCTYYLKNDPKHMKSETRFVFVLCVSVFIDFENFVRTTTSIFISFFGVFVHFFWLLLKLVVFCLESVFSRDTDKMLVGIQSNVDCICIRWFGFFQQKNDILFYSFRDRTKIRQHQQLNKNFNMAQSHNKNAQSHWSGAHALWLGSGRWWLILFFILCLSPVWLRM